jgi:hypothetical protein
MSQSRTPIWNPSSILEIINDHNDISCAGVTQKGLPCGYHLGGEPKSQARQLLGRMSQKPPRRALSDLPELAEYCLCKKSHQGQARTVVADWTAIIEPFLTSHEKEKEKPKQPDIDEIIAELEALSIRQQKLRRMLRDAQGGGSDRNTPDSGTTRTTPSRSTSDFNNQSQLSELEASEPGESERRESASSTAGRKRGFWRRKRSD